MPERNELLREAANRHFDRLERAGPAIRPDSKPLPYDTCPLIEKVRWRVPLIGETLVRHELEELTNGANKWWGTLRRWDAWVDVINTYETEDDALAVQWEFLEPLAFHCMFQPSATRDRLTLVATNALHQALLTRDPGHPDHLPGEKLRKDGTPQLIGRTEAGVRLTKLIARFTEQTHFTKALGDLDGGAYRDKTRNFRNLASHAIAPRLGWGYTGIARRVLVPGPSPYSPTSSADHHVVYPFGGTPPIPVREAFELNLAEYECAVEAIACYRLLLDEVLRQLPLE